jgi:hypothetical protein
VLTIDESSGATVVSHDSTALTKATLAASAVLLAVAAYDLFIGSRGTERLVGLIGAATTCFLVAIVFLEQAWFRFAPDVRIVTWRRRWALQQRSGSIAFDAIHAVLVERPIGDEGTPSRRRIRGLLGHDGEATHLQNVKTLIAAGRVIDAIRVLREEEGLSLLDAKRQVEKIGDVR